MIFFSISGRFRAFMGIKLFKTWIKEILKTCKRHRVLIIRLPKKGENCKELQKKIQQLLEGMRPINLFQQDFFKKSELTSAHDTELSALRLNVRKINFSEAQFRGRASAVPKVIAIRFYS